MRKPIRFQSGRVRRIETSLLPIFWGGGAGGSLLVGETRSVGKVPFYIKRRRRVETGLFPVR